MAITLTREAAKAVQKLMQEKGPQDTLVLRFGAIGGVDSGLSYTLELEQREKMDPSDRISVSYGITIVVGPDSYAKAGESLIYYKKEGLTGGFAVANPSEALNCGCGISFVGNDKKRQPNREHREKGVGIFFLLLYIKIVLASNAATYGALLAYYLIFGKTDTTAVIILHYLAAATATFVIVPLFISAMPLALLAMPFIFLFQ